MAVDKKNIFLINTAENMSYTSTPLSIEKTFPKRNVKSHADFIRSKLQESYTEDITKKKAAAIRYKEGIYLEFSSAPAQELAIKSLENRGQGIRLLNVQEDSETKITKATVYIPVGKEAYFIDKVNAYASELTKTNKPKNNDLISSLEDVKLAILDSFWTCEKEYIPTSDSVWCEIWLRFDYDKKNHEYWKESEMSFMESCKLLQIHVNRNRILFPERIVKLVLADINQLQALIGICPFISEIRRAQDVASFFQELTNSEQQEWVEELLSRTNYLDQNLTLCLLDTGLTSGHPLLQKAIQPDGVHSVKSVWGTGDHESHGTEMAGLALYNDLKNALSHSLVVQIPHKLESVKILPPKGNNPPELYGSITEQAIALAEIANPEVKRVICMAVTAPCYNTKEGSPSSWSAAIDSITSAAEDEGDKRLFFISAGNVYPSELSAISYPNSSVLHGVESPGQAWNAITVGAYSKDNIITDPSFKGYSPVADVGELSPYSSTSQTWSSKWPIKPEILLDGGNVATNGMDFTEAPDLSLLTTHYRPLIKQFSTIWGTSSATAQAAWMGVQLMAEYPHAWPETIRALMIHSASWTDKMRKQFCHEDTKTKGRRHLLRNCGYGIPNLQKAIQCMNNSVNLVIEGELQPFEKKSMKNMHLHNLPWPREQLLSLGEVPVTLRITLSYFIEPGPGEVGWKDKYRYPSCGLRFDVINTNETVDDFKKRVNYKMRGEDKKDKGEGTSGSERWYLGSVNRDVGSIHSDYFEANAIDLYESNYIAIYPVVGWWRERSYLGKSDSPIRYSLVVSIATPKVDVDLYTPIVTVIKPAAEILIPL